MIVGKVRRREAVIPLTVIGSDRRLAKIEAVIDTGYTGWLTLPPELIESLSLRWDGIGQGTLADKSVVVYDVYLGRIA